MVKIGSNIPPAPAPQEGGGPGGTAGSFGATNAFNQLANIAQALGNMLGSSPLPRDYHKLLTKFEELLGRGISQIQPPLTEQQQAELKQALVQYVKSNGENAGYFYALPNSVQSNPQVQDLWDDLAQD